MFFVEPHHNQPPRITKRLSRVSVPLGYRATLPCVAQGYPVPTFRWHRAKSDQRPLPDHTISVSQEGGVLIFHKVVPSDSGRYICRVSNNVGEDEVDTELIVEGNSIFYLFIFGDDVVFKIIYVDENAIGLGRIK